MTHHGKWLALSAAALFAGCASTPPPTDPPKETVSKAAPVVAKAPAPALPESQAVRINLNRDSGVEEMDTLLAAPAKRFAKEPTFPAKPEVVPDEQADAGKSLFTDLSKGYWVVKPGMTLKETVQRWAQRVNWTVAWGEDTPDFMMSYPFRLQGDFRGVINQLFSLYSEQGASFEVTGYTRQYILSVKRGKL